MESTALPFDKVEIESSLPYRFEKIVRQFPDCIAIKTGDGSWNYATLNVQANKLAHALLEKYGSGSEPLPFLLGRVETQIAAMLGVQKAGKFYLPLERSLPRARLNFMLEDSQARVLITDDLNRSLAEELARGNASLIIMDDLETGAPMENPGLEIMPDAPVYILYTSGSSGQPKGVVQNHRNLLHSIWGATRNYHITPQDRFGLLTSTAFAASNGPIYGSLLNGASVHHYDMRGSLAALPQWIEMQQITLLLMVPSTFRQLALSLTGKEDFSSLRLIVLMGERLSRSHIDLYRQYFPLTCLLRNSYAATEMHTVCSLTIDHQTEFNGSQIPVGKAVPDKEILLLDEAGEGVEAGQVGEIVIRSRYLSPGYWRKPDLTSACFMEEPGSDKRMYFTGDLGRMDPDGHLTDLGRKDLLVKIRGYRVELGEIEVTLAEHPAIKECAVVVEEREGENQRLIGYYVSEWNSSAIPTEELRIFLRKKLPDYMVPLAFVHLDMLPLTPNGKLDRQALPGLDRVLNLEKDYVSPRDEVEDKLVKLWEEMLEVSPIGIQNDFFRIGGHSLLAARMIAKVEEMFGQRLDLGALAQATTIAELAEVVRRDNGDGKPISLVTIRASGNKPPLYCVHGVGGHIFPFLDLAYHLGNEQPVYALQAKPVQVGDKRTIEGMARDYIEEVEQFQPEGPYYLAGYSFGGYIAYEMARQLEAKGKVVALLALFDTQAGSLPRFPDSLSNIRFLGYRVRAFVVKVLLRLSKLKLSSIIRNQDSKQESVSQNEIIFGEVDAETVPAHLREIIRVNQAALTEYVPGQYGGLITLVKSSYDGRGVYFGWEVFTSSGVRIYEVPGTHRTMMQEPNVRILADQLKQCIASCAESNTIL